MPDPNMTILYVESPPASAAFYGCLLGREPVESSATFAMFACDGLRLGLWSRHTVEPASTPVGGHELAFAVPDADAVHEAWARLGVPILQLPTDMDFGRTFVAVDPDGHRLRVFTPGEEE